jgi:hypothetical protein
MRRLRGGQHIGGLRVRVTHGGDHSGVTGKPEALQILCHGGGSSVSGGFLLRELLLVCPLELFDLGFV